MSYKVIFGGSLIFLLMVLSACNDLEREQQLTERENSLLEREKQFAQKESEYQLLLKMRDSLLTKHKDTVFYTQWPDNFAGLWNTKIVCIESNCPDYVVGDIRSDQWEFGSDSSQLVVKSISNKKLTRIYNATYSDNQISLSYQTDSLSGKKVEMSVLLNDIGVDKIKGTRSITVDDKCTAKFTVELVKSTK